MCFGVIYMFIDKNRDLFNHNFQMFKDKFLNRQLIDNYPSGVGPVHLYSYNLIENFIFMFI